MLSSVRVGHRFVDVVSQLPDGRLLIDYTKFHDTVPDGAPAPAALRDSEGAPPA